MRFRRTTLDQILLPSFPRRAKILASSLNVRVCARPSPGEDGGR